MMLDLVRSRIGSSNTPSDLLVSRWLTERMRVPSSVSVDGSAGRCQVQPPRTIRPSPKNYKNAKVEVGRSGGLFSPVREKLMVNGRDRSKLLDSVARQAAAVHTALSTFHHSDVTAADIPVVAVLCFVDAVLPMFGTPRIGGVPLLGPRGTAKLLRKATGSLDEDTLAALHHHLAQALPTA